ncbi:hypothetical protein J31TS4_15820 [Paenibacillus sp. J31TS4]|uniref:hypothetical protein n=1 Tax=Paenibacillus sp. J31TS4 TaxID=2807195 RepID=UPI001B22866B|nr:hypothetical protein [Paenibacillus sp. J31TS4]GIP38302.1 hypothetical protein J31TS4_15820 [Paenibacillus sp. J31TS4]
MTEQRKAEIVSELKTIAETFKPSEDEPILDMFVLISRYNATGKNAELIGGDWVIENCPEPLKSLPA